MMCALNIHVGVDYRTIAFFVVNDLGRCKCY